MHVTKFLHTLLINTIHKSRLKLLVEVVESLIICKELKLTKVGRAINTGIQERSGIRKVDRLLSNVFLQNNPQVIYTAIVRNVIGNQLRPGIIVDWSKIPNCDEYILRAALMAPGRSITLYEEVHPQKKVGNERIHRGILKVLKEMLPEECKPILITDAGFKNPWFKAVSKLGWDYVGRVRGGTKCSDNDGFSYEYCSTLYRLASNKARYLGEKLLARKNPLSINFYIYQHKLKGRKALRKNGKKKIDKDSKNYSRAYREPWLLVSSLKGTGAATKVVKIYKNRMTIEESFRDLKSSQYGFSMDNNKTLKRERLAVWLLLAALASLVAWLVGAEAEKANIHRQFQANSTRNRRVISFFYLGCQVIRKKMKIPISFEKISEVVEAIGEFRYA